MGGHGGLNILPQKRWNVYGRENRLKVAEDEAAHASEQSALEHRRASADAERRRAALVARARGRQGAPVVISCDEGAPALDCSTPDAEPREQPGPASSSASAPRLSERATPSPASTWRALPPAAAPAPAPSHVNLFWEQEQRDEQVEAAARKAQALRGNPKTRTSDARFDAQFAFAHSAKGEAERPWYARRPSDFDEAPEAGGDRGARASSASPLQERAESRRSSGKARRRSRSRSPRRHRGSRSRQLARSKSPERDARARAERTLKTELFAELRAERLAREREERLRVEKLVGRQG